MGIYMYLSKDKTPFPIKAYFLILCNETRKLYPAPHILLASPLLPAAICNSRGSRAAPLPCRVTLLPHLQPCATSPPHQSLLTEGSRPSQDILIPQASSLSAREDFKALLGSGFRSFSGKTKEGSNCSLWGMMQSSWLHFVKENELSPGYPINKSVKTICKSY